MELTEEQKEEEFIYLTKSLSSRINAEGKCDLGSDIKLADNHLDSFVVLLYTGRAAINYQKKLQEKYDIPPDQLKVCIETAKSIELTSSLQIKRDSLFGQPKQLHSSEEEFDKLFKRFATPPTPKLN